MHEIAEQAKIERGLLHDEMVHVACAICSGTLPECPELQWDTLKVYPQTDKWTDDIIRQLDLIQTTAPVSTRKNQKHKQQI